MKLETLLGYFNPVRQALDGPVLLGLAEVNVLATLALGFRIIRRRADSLP